MWGFHIYKRIIFDPRFGGLRYRLDRSRIATSLRRSTNQPSDRCPGSGLRTPLGRRIRQAVAVPVNDLSGHRSELQRRARALQTAILPRPSCRTASLPPCTDCTAARPAPPKCARPSECPALTSAAASPGRTRSGGSRSSFGAGAF